MIEYTRTMENYFSHLKSNTMDKHMPPRKELVDILKELLSDEYDANDLVYLTDGELVNKIIDSAIWYRDSYNDVDSITNFKSKN